MHEAVHPALSVPSIELARTHACMHPREAGNPCGPHALAELAYACTAA